jgi:hypothetical protein
VYFRARLLPTPAIKSIRVMPGFVPGIHVFLFGAEDVDGRDKPGHDEKTQIPNQ